MQDIAGLNSLEQREPRELPKSPLLGTGTAGDDVLHKIASNPDLSDHILSAGPHYTPSDVRFSTVAPLGDHTSGVLREYTLK